MPQKLTVEIKPYDPSAPVLQGVRTGVERTLRRALGSAEHRLLALRLHPPEQKSARPARASRFQATVVDYAGGRTLDLHGDVRDPKRIEVVESARQPAVTHAEFEDAVEVLRLGAEFGKALRDGKLQPYRPMPPHVPIDRPDGSRERHVTVGLLPANGGKARHEVVAVSLAQKRIVRFVDRAPARSLAVAAVCGVLAGADQATADQGTPGTVRIRVRRGSTLLWEFIATRPAASSGYWGSGIELRNVSYRGRSVLYQAHVPILNVRYDGDKCGPYRDWQWQEGMIHADGADVAPGFRLCAAPAKTIFDTGSDVGDFLGVGVYVAGEDVVLVSELEAGWYRYVSEWRLRANGEIRPRFLFGATSSSCVCNVHHHHVYWRFDFDVAQAKNVVEEFNDPALGGGSKWKRLAWETRRMRDATHKRRWRVGDGAGHWYEIVPGPHDHTAAGDAYGKGDVWAVRYRANQLDDHPAAGTEAEIDRFVNRESIVDQDVVVWYGAHFEHDVRHHGPADADHIVGPTLVPRGW
jgi:hypothetical protein